MTGPIPFEWNNWQRIVIGDVPGSFYIEVIIRTAFIYALLMVSMRLMGKRMASQLGQNEMIAMVCLAAAIGIPIQSSDRGLVPALVIASIVVVVHQIIARRATTDQGFEALTQDNFDTLIADGKLQLDCMLETRLTRERVFAQLRNLSIVHLGEVKRLYLEANGTFTLIKNATACPGLSIIPDWDGAFLNKRARESGEVVCNCCGARKRDQESGRAECAECKQNDWVPAVV